MAQEGLVTVDDARRCGIPERTLRARATREGWVSRSPGVWTMPGVPRSPRHDALAAVLGTGGTLARRSAAWVWGIRDQAPPIPEVVVPAVGGVRPRSDLRVLRSRTLRPDDLVEHEGLPVTSVARTIADLSSVTPEQRLVSLIVATRQRGLVTPEQLAVQYGGMGRAHGAARLRRALVVIGKDGVDSALELEIRQALATLGFPAPHPQPLRLRGRRGRVFEVDVPWPSVRTGIEVDGFAYHHTHDDLVRDHSKGNEAAVVDWTLLRVGWWRWQYDRHGFLSELAEVLSRKGLPVRWPAP